MYSPAEGEAGSPSPGRECFAVVGDVRYEIRIKGRVGDPVLASLAGMDARVRPAETVLRGELGDQAALHGVLARIAGLGLELIEVRETRDARRPDAP